MFTDPDLVSGDGIYSRYLTTYPFPGKYVFTITVTGNSNTTGMFTRSLSGPVVDIASVDMEEDVFPPAKIGDLSAVYDNNTHLLLSWTTPGGDYNDGAVCGYHLLYSSSCDSLLLGQDSDSIVFYLRHKAGVKVERTPWCDGNMSRETSLIADKLSQVQLFFFNSALFHLALNSSSVTCPQFFFCDSAFNISLTR